MVVKYGSGQTDGLPLLITAITQGARQLLHTAVAGAGDPELIGIRAQNLDQSLAHTLYVALEDTGATLLRLFKVEIPVGAALFDVLGAIDSFEAGAVLILNGAATIKVYADVASKLAVYASVNDQQ